MGAYLFILYDEGAKKLDSGIRMNFLTLIYWFKNKLENKYSLKPSLSNGLYCRLNHKTSIELFRKSQYVFLVGQKL